MWLSRIVEGSNRPARYQAHQWLGLQNGSQAILSLKEGVQLDQPLITLRRQKGRCESPRHGFGLDHQLRHEWFDRLSFAGPFGFEASQVPKQIRGAIVADPRGEP